MKSPPIITIFSPYYVLLTGSLGVFLALALFTWNYPSPGDKVGQAFVSAQPFFIWVFLFGILCCLLTILFVPLWGMLIQLTLKRFESSDDGQKRKITILLVLQAILLTAIVFSLLQFISAIRTGFDLFAYAPQGHSARMNFMYIYTFLTTLPALLGMVLIQGRAQELSQKIDSVTNTETAFFPLINELLSLRSILQNYLTILGIILSMIPINTAGLRAILIALDIKNEQTFPITNAILFGLIFTLILLLIYIPAHLALIETSRKLRDHLCPLDSLSSLKQDIEQRKTLDDLLQTNIGITENLKTGLITLAPLATSMISSILKINLPF